MKNYVQIKLADEQVQELQGLQKMVDNAYFDDNPGSILAQVSPLSGTMVCGFCTNEEVKKMYSALGKEPPL